VRHSRPCMQEPSVRPALAEHRHQRTLEREIRTVDRDRRAAAACRSSTVSSPEPPWFHSVMPRPTRKDACALPEAVEPSSRAPKPGHAEEEQERAAGNTPRGFGWNAQRPESASTPAIGLRPQPWNNEPPGKAAISGTPRGPRTPKGETPGNCRCWLPLAARTPAGELAENSAAIACLCDPAPNIPTPEDTPRIRNGDADHGARLIRAIAPREQLAFQHDVLSKPLEHDLVQIRSGEKADARPLGPLKRNSRRNLQLPRAGEVVVG
jgi:hypothetical protein